MALRIPQSATTSMQSFGPFRTYMLSRGLIVRLDREGAVIEGGAGSQITLRTDDSPNEFGWLTSQAYAELMHQAQCQVSANLVGATRADRIAPEVYADLIEGLPREIAVRLSGNDESPPSEVMFIAGDRIISDRWLGEELLGRFLVLENLVRATALKVTGVSRSVFEESQEFVAVLDDAVLDGRIGPETVDAITADPKGIPTEVKVAFFVSNSISIADDVRLAIVAAGHHLATLNSGILSINEKGPLQAPTSISGDDAWEIRHISEETDRLSFSHTSSIVACCTALDILYELFVYLTKEPFLDPTFPTGLYFPNARRPRIFRMNGRPEPDDPSSAALPLAIPNLALDYFTPLMRVRNDVIHNMAADGLRTVVRVGSRLPPVNYQPLQYVQYVSRDIDPTGKPVKTQWRRRFYEQQTDAQDFLYSWVERTWQCIFDTTEWLIERWKGNLARCTNANGSP